MKYWVVSPNLGAAGEKDLDAWIEFIQRRKIAVMGWGEDNRIGKAFKNEVQIGDFILVASGSNANKRLCIAGIVAGDAEDDFKEKTPTGYSFFRKLNPSIDLPADPSEIGLSFEGAAHGEAHRIPAMYRLYPSTNGADKVIVDKLLKLLGMNSSVSEEREPDDEIVKLFTEFKQKYLDTGDGDYHRKLLFQGRAQGKKNYKIVLDLQREGKDITDAVLYGLLPYADTQNNREKGHWIHVAPSVTKDIKEWFEGAGWVKGSDWPDVANRLFAFIRKAIDEPANIGSLCEEFDTEFPFKGFQVGMLSPILNALDPEHYFVVNAKPVSVINWLSGAQYKARIKEMPDIIETIREWVNENKGLLEPITPEGLNIFDTFDIFCHWLKGVKKYQKLDSRFSRYGRGSLESAGQVFAKIFPDPAVRKTAEDSGRNALKEPMRKIRIVGK